MEAGKSNVGKLIALALDADILNLAADQRNPQAMLTIKSDIPT